MKKILLFALVLAMVALSAGCDGTTNPPVTPTTTTTSTTVADATTTAADTTTTPTSTTTEAGTTTTAPVQAEPALQIGGATFTLDGVTFKMGEAPDKLLAHLGEPNRVSIAADDIELGYTVRYYYDHLMIEAFSRCDSEEKPALEELTDLIVRMVYFIDDHYSFDGITVGDTAKKVNELISNRLKPWQIGNKLKGPYGGPYFSYDADREILLQDRNKSDRVSWYVLFSEDSQVETEYIDGELNVTIPDDAIVSCIAIDGPYWFE